METLMKNTRISRVAAAIVTMIALAAILLAQHNVAQANDEGCNLATVKGVYGIATAGLVSTTFAGDPQPIGEFVPLSAVGTFSFDGRGTTSRSLTISFGGATFPVSDSGPYTVNADCSMSATYSDGTWSMTIIGRGKEIKAMNTAPGTVVQGILTKQ
jgi:hypothetical protein